MVLQNINHRSATIQTNVKRRRSLQLPASSLAILLLSSIIATQQPYFAASFTPASTSITKNAHSCDGYNPHVTNGYHHSPFFTTVKLLSYHNSVDDGYDNDNGSDDDDYYVPLWKIEEVDRVCATEIDSSLEGSASSPQTYPNPLSLKEKIPDSWFVEHDAAVAARVNVDVHQTCIIDQEAAAPAFLMAGPRKEIALDPEISRAAIVTCGGLCPGLNTVVREITMCLRRQYGVEHVYGIREGYRGFLDAPSWLPLDEATVSNYHNMGGSVLGSSRGGHDTEAIVESLVAQNINLLFVVGGDGTLRGAARIAEEVKRRALQISVAIVPKTIDNDIPLIDKTFGFETAVEAARSAIDVANVESDGFPLGLGVVKVMGRNSGFIAMHSCLGSRVADLCLIPEVDFYLDGPGGIVDHLAERLIENDKAVIVVAEGAGQKLIAEEKEADEDNLQDLSGNKLLDDIGPWLTKKLKTKLNAKLEGKTKHDDSVYIKYVDPSYMVRGIPPNTADNVYCTQLAHNAVHGAFAGFTSFVVGSVNTRACYVPTRLVANKRNIIDTNNQSLWEYVVFDTGQPCFAKENKEQYRNKVVTVSASGGIILELD